MGDTQQPIVGRACQQTDGSWRVAEGTPEQPGQYVAVYPPAYGYYYPGYDPWFWDPPIGLSLGAVVFLDRAHHIHRFPTFHRHFAHGGFGHAGWGGFHPGLGHGGWGGGMHRG
jgi:surface antigen